MRCISKRFISLVMVLFLIFGCFGISVSAEGENIFEDDGQMDLDVVFVLDSSGSMLESDPNRVAVDAFSLFVDLCDDSCGVGYTVYSEKIKESENITLLDKNHLSALKTKISSLNRNPYGDTDIALGLTEAMKLHKDNPHSDSGRKKIIILLSDGNTHLISGPRTVAESQKEMESTLQSLNESNIPVYAIGLNYDGTLDKNETQKIASQTNGKSYEAKASDELPAIVADIFADVYQITGAQKEIVDGDVEITVKDNSVFYVNIVIRSRLTVDQLNPTLLSPRREKVKLNGEDDNIKMTSTGSYTLIKLIYPQSGKWRLHLDNATSQNCIVTQLDFYSVFVKQNIDTTLIVGQTARIEASLNQSGGIVSDSDLINTIQMTATITANGETQQVELTPQSNYMFVGEFIPETAGSYTIITTAKSEKFYKNSTPLTLNVRKYTDEELKNRGGTTSTDIGLSSDNQFTGSLTIIIIGLVLAILAAIIIVIVIFKVKEKNDQKALSVFDAPKENLVPTPRPTPVAPPIEKVKEGPKPTDPDYVNIPLVAHGSLESLIKKGPDDAFNSNADDYKTDASLEALIKKGPDTNLGIGTANPAEEDFSEFDNNTNESYQTGHNLSDMMGNFDDNPSGGINLNKRF